MHLVVEKIVHFGIDTLCHATAIQDGVEMEEVRIEIINDRKKFPVPVKIPKGKVLIKFEVPEDKNMELMRKISRVLAESSSSGRG